MALGALYQLLCLGDDGRYGSIGVVVLEHKGNNAVSITKLVKIHKLLSTPHLLGLFQVLPTDIEQPNGKVGEGKELLAGVGREGEVVPKEGRGGG